MWRDALRSRKTHVLLAVAALYLAWQVWLTVAAPGKIAGFPAGGERVNILVTLPFPPERFHIQLFQTYGTRVRNTRKCRRSSGSETRGPHCPRPPLLGEAHRAAATGRMRRCDVC